MQHAADYLSQILELWPELDNTPTGRRHDTPREQTPEQRDRARARWAEEQADRLAGAIGRGASPAPGNIDQLATKIDADAELCALADRVAHRVQPPADPGPLNPGHWDYTHHHGAPWAITWLLGALHGDTILGGVPPLLEDDITATARRILRRLQTALDGQRERPAGRCACGAALTVADWDQLITCTTCGTAHGRRDWLKLRNQNAA